MSRASALPASPSPARTHSSRSSFNMFTEAVCAGHRTAKGRGLRGGGGGRFTSLRVQQQLWRSRFTIRTRVEQCNAAPESGSSRCQSCCLSASWSARHCVLPVARRALRRAGRHCHVRLLSQPDLSIRFLQPTAMLIAITTEKLVKRTIWRDVLLRLRGSFQSIYPPEHT